MMHEQLPPPAHQWILPEGDIQQHPYVPPAPAIEKRVDEEMEEQRVAPPMKRIKRMPHQLSQH